MSEQGTKLELSPEGVIEKREKAVSSLAWYILYGSVEDKPKFDELARDAWKSAALAITEYTASLQRILTYDERVELFMQSSQAAFEEHQRLKEPRVSELLPIPGQFLNPKIVSEEGWEYLSPYYEPRNGRPDISAVNA